MNFCWLTLKQLQKDALWWTIYFNSFPATELDSQNQILMARKNNFAHTGCVILDCTTIAIVVLYPMKDLPFAFLNYIAIDKKIRGQGIGQWLMMQVILAAERLVRSYHSHYLGLIWELEDPDQTHDRTQKQIQQRRIEFYTRLGARLLPDLICNLLSMA